MKGDNQRVRGRCPRTPSGPTERAAAKHGTEEETIMKKIIIAMSLVGIGMGAVASIPALTPVERKDMAYITERWNEKKKEIAAGGAKVVFIGDSITHFWENYGGGAYGKYFMSGEAKVLNLGFASDQTQHTLWRIQNGALDGYEAKCIVVMIGSNNVGLGGTPAMDTVFAIRQILEEIRKKQPKALIVLHPIFPRGKDKTDALRKVNDVVNLEIQKFCNGKDIVWCDFTEQLMTLDGELPKGWFGDYLHPSGTAYEIWHAALHPYIEYALSDGARGSAVNRYPAFVTGEKVRMEGGSYAWPATRISGGGAEEFVWRERLLATRNAICSLKGKDVDVAILSGGVVEGWNDAKGFDDWKSAKSVLVLAGFHESFGNVMWNAKNGFLDGYKAKVVVVTQNEPWPVASAAEMADGVRELVEVVRSKQPQAKIVVTSIWPAKEDGTNAERNNAAANKLLKAKVEKLPNVQWVNTDSVSTVESWKAAVGTAL